VLQIEREHRQVIGRSVIEERTAGRIHGADLERENGAHRVHRIEPEVQQFAERPGRGARGDDELRVNRPGQADGAAGHGGARRSDRRIEAVW
jgi:hypothetical protein